MYCTWEGNQPSNEESLIFYTVLTCVYMYMFYHTPLVINPSYMYLLHGYGYLRLMVLVVSQIRKLVSILRGNPFHIVLNLVFVESTFTGGLSNHEIFEILP